MSASIVPLSMAASKVESPWARRVTSPTSQVTLGRRSACLSRMYSVMIALMSTLVILPVWPSAHMSATQGLFPDSSRRL